jgi:hypothetical protein
MDEFNNRMEAQRAVLAVVNHHAKFTEELCGLSKKAIERWLRVNQLEPTGEIATILFQISSKLFFLSSKSQEQVTEEYRLLAADVRSLTGELETLLRANDAAATG